MCAGACVCVWVWVCVCVCVCVCVLRIVSRDKILHFKNTFIIIIPVRETTSWRRGETVRETTSWRRAKLSEKLRVGEGRNCQRNY